MATARTHEQPEDLLRVSAYDRASSLLISLLVLVGTATAMLFILWLTSRVFFQKVDAVIVPLEEESGTQNPPGTARDVNEPGVEELNDLIEPDVKETLEAVTEALSSIAASLDAVDGVMATRGKGAGDNRKRGNGDDVIPRWERWEIRYSSTTLSDYRKQLGFFGIELGAIGGGRKGVDYVSFANGGAKARSSTDEDERLYFRWQGGPFKDLDRQLMEQAGVPTTGRILCQFFSPELENQLAVLEKQKMGDRHLREIKKTLFGVQGSGNSFEFFVMEIRWR